ncbi:DUF58 domain-containing protein [Allonocardiopsis opalescens]|uniref:Uncharacterized protein DUF58 n=1 Tax=Allonocardiopsis opalescens TaxID=1144618 RepID=A0A2T0PTT9_9ACTN|nr:DUF58 domain-containing protein [Allonocardiopsis opalescens]PRX92310.1 uncharacterized protein DUF58 [Allonocardiopsis opalescens]
MPTQPGRTTHPAALRRLHLKVVRQLDGILHGEHLGLHTGPGSDLAEARPYQPGDDDIRHMDWAVTARTTTPHVRDLIADRELHTWALIDLTPSMDFGTAHTTKRELALTTLTAFAHLTSRLGNRFGAHVLHHRHLTRHPAAGNRQSLLVLLNRIATTPPPPAPTGTPPTELPTAINALTRAHHRRGLRIVISDFLDSTPHPDPTTPRAWERPLRQLATRHQTIAVEILDPRELDLPDIGTLTLHDPETGQTRDIHLTARLRRRYAAAAHAQRAATHTALRRCGVPHLQLRTDRDPLTDIARFVIEQRRTATRLHRHTPTPPRPTP